MTHLSKETQSTGTVRLMNSVFYAHHGISQEEHRLGGRYEVDVILHFPFDEAAETDKLEATVDYEHVYRVVRDLVTQNKFYLIEKLAYLIGHKIIDAYEIVDRIEVSVRKNNPPVGGPCDHAEATFRIDRN